MISFVLSIILDLIPFGQTFYKPVSEEQRDSLLVGDQIKFGFNVGSLLPGTSLGFPEMEQMTSDTLVLVNNWQIDTLKDGSFNAYVVLAPFEEGVYRLPDVPVLRAVGEVQDTIVFEGCEMTVCPIPIDTATFRIHDLKEQINYPVTFAEVATVTGISLGGLAALAGLVFLIMYMVSRFSRGGGRPERRDPAHIVALRGLEKYRSKDNWQAEKQKRFYSGVTDILKVYVKERFSVDAPEMTTAELFDALKDNPDIPSEMYASLLGMFRRADFVKFAKYTASDEDNATVVPLAVRFVNTTYEVQLAGRDEEGGRK